MVQQKMLRKKKNVKKGIQFCLMVCGASGTGTLTSAMRIPCPATTTSDNIIIGRTTFVNTLCSQGVLQHKDSDDAGDAHVEDSVKIKPVTVGS